MTTFDRDKLGAMRRRFLPSLLVRLLSLLVGLGLAYAIFAGVAQYSTSTRFVVAFMFALLLGYSIAMVNVWATRREGGSIPRISAIQRLIGHVLLGVAAVAMGFGFAFRSTVLMVLGFVPWWIAGEKLVSVRWGKHEEGLKKPSELSPSLLNASAKNTFLARLRCRIFGQMLTNSFENLNLPFDKLSNLPPILSDETFKPPEKRISAAAIVVGKGVFSLHRFSSDPREQGRESWTTHCLDEFLEKFLRERIRASAGGAAVVRTNLPLLVKEGRSIEFEVEQQRIETLLNAVLAIQLKSIEHRLHKALFALIAK